MKYHSGSLAFGAFCISFAKVCRLLLAWATKQEESHSSNGAVRCCMRCTNCLAACIERFIQFVSEHAYVEVALQGRNFCHSAKTALKMSIDEPALFGLIY